MTENIAPGKRNGKRQRLGEHIRRTLGFCCLVLLWLPSLVLAVLSGYAWWRTLQVTRTFLGFDEEPITQTDQSGLLARLIRFDLSTASAAIVLMFSVCLFFGITRIVVRRLRAGAWEQFASRTKGPSLFPKGLRALCIRFGLLGTLLSFTFAAMGLSGSEVGEYGVPDVRQVRDQRDSIEVSADPGRSRASLAQRASKPETDGNADGEKQENAEIVGSVSGGVSSLSLALPGFRVGSGDSSFKVFLMLCAALYSTLVGALVGYLLIPAIEVPAGWAAGRQDSPTDDAEVVQRRYLQRLEMATNGLDLLICQTDSFRRAGAALERGVNALDAAVVRIKDFGDSVNGLYEGAAEMKAAASRSTEAANALTGLSGTLGEAMETYKKQVSQTEVVIAELRKVSKEERDRLARTFQGLTVAVETMKTEFVGPIHRFVAYWPALLNALVAEVKRSLQLQDEQKALAERIAKAIEACGKPIRYGGEQLARTTESLTLRIREARNEHDRLNKEIDRMFALSNHLWPLVLRLRAMRGDPERSDPSPRCQRDGVLPRPGLTKRLFSAFVRHERRGTKDHVEADDPTDKDNRGSVRR